MEQKRTLWIVAAAGIFLLVVVGAALIIYSPSLHNTPVQQASFDPSTGWVNASAAPQSSTPATPAPDAFGTPAGQSEQAPFDPLAHNGPNTALPAVPDFNAPAHESNQMIQAQNVNIFTQETTTFDLNALKASNTTSTVTAQNQKTVEQISSTSTAKNSTAAAPVQENYYTPKTTTRPVEKTTVATAPKTAPAKPAVKTTATAKASTAEKVAASAKKSTDLFWVQVAAYSSKKNADEARAVLEQNKIPVEVFTDSKYFRVRVGPYQTKSEASYWQKRISEIGKFADTKTMIVNSAVQK